MTGAETAPRPAANPAAALVPSLLLPDASLYDQRSTTASRSTGKQRVAQAAHSSSPADWALCVERVAVERCRDSFMQLFDYYAPRIGTYLRQQGASQQAAEELSQEAMLSLWRKAHLYDRSKASVSTWLFRIARNVMIDQLRRERGIAYEEEDSAAELIADDDAPAASDAAALRRRVTELPAVQAELIYKSYFEGKSHGEIAAETGQPLGSVKSRLRAALKRLRHDFNVEFQ